MLLVIQIFTWLQLDFVQWIELVFNGKLFCFVNLCLDFTSPAQLVCILRNTECPMAHGKSLL